MALKDILQYATEVTGIQLTSDLARAQLLRYINRAAQEIYDTWDLPGSVGEQAFAIQRAETQATFPWYVGEIRAVRRPQYQNKVRVVGMEPRYQHTPWRQPWYEWRIKGKTPLLQNLTQSGALTVAIPYAETSTFSVTIVGQTTTAYRAEETLVFEPGDVTKTTTNLWLHVDPFGIVAISKDAVTNSNIGIYQAADLLQVAEIANRLPTSENTLVQIHDGSQILADVPSVEVLYKRRYIPLYSDNDIFYDAKMEDAIIWKMREHWHSQKQETGSLDYALMCSGKCKDIVVRIAQDQEAGEQKRIQVAPNRFEYPVYLDTYLWPYSLSRPTYGV